LSPDWRDGQDFQVISSISTIQVNNGLVGWLPVFHSLSQTIDMQFLASLDGGRTWWRPERRSAVPFKELGYYGGGMMWPYRLFVPDHADPTKVHAYFSGCQGRHSDIHSTLAGERFAAMRGQWTSYGAWGYGNLVRSCGSVCSVGWFMRVLICSDACAHMFRCFWAFGGFRRLLSSTSLTLVVDVPTAIKPRDLVPNRQ
jgi:hypothetical protein